jgi:predicted nucleic acid-binding protein
VNDGVLFDTSVLIEPRPSDLGEFATASPSVSAITVAELTYGLDADDPLERHVRAERLEWVLGRFPVLPFDLAEAKIYGTLAALVRRAGRDPRPRRLDLQIAATAVTNSLPLVTRNEKDFAGLDRLLQVIPV